MSYWFARAWHILGTLAIYLGSGSLTFIFFQAITPPGLWWFPLAALGLFEFGIIHWSSYHREVSENPQQAITSVIMVAISVLGVAVSTGFELVRMLAPSFGLSLGWMNYALWLVVFIFPINVLGVQLCKMLSNEHLDLWAAVCERTGERPRMRPIKIRHWWQSWGRVKEAPTQGEQKQLDGATEPMESIAEEQTVPISKVKKMLNKLDADTLEKLAGDMSNSSAASSVKKKLPPLKVR